MNRWNNSICNFNIFRERKVLNRTFFCDEYTRKTDEIVSSQISKVKMRPIKVILYNQRTFRVPIPYIFLRKNQKPRKGRQWKKNAIE